MCLRKTGPFFSSSHLSHQEEAGEPGISTHNTFSVCKGDLCWSVIVQRLMDALLIVKAQGGTQALPCLTRRRRVVVEMHLLLFTGCATAAR